MKRHPTGLRPRLPFGPATLATTALAVLLSQQLPFPGHRSRSPALRRKTVDVPVTGSLSPPEPAWLRQQAERLELTPGQRKHLARLETRWTHETRPLRETLEGASNAFVARADTVGTKPVSVRELQERSGSVSLLTGQLLAARSAWWNEASQTLTGQQRQQAERLWSQRYAKHARGRELLR